MRVALCSMLNLETIHQLNEIVYNFLYLMRTEYLLIIILIFILIKVMKMH